MNVIIKGLRSEVRELKEEANNYKALYDSEKEKRERLEQTRRSLNAYILGANRKVFFLRDHVQDRYAQIAGRNAVIRQKDSEIITLKRRLANSNSKTYELIVENGSLSRELDDVEGKYNGNLKLLSELKKTDYRRLTTAIEKLSSAGGRNEQGDAGDEGMDEAGDATHTSTSSSTSTVPAGNHLKLQATNKVIPKKSGRFAKNGKVAKTTDKAKKEDKKKVTMKKKAKKETKKDLHPVQEANEAEQGPSSRLRPREK